MIFKTGWAFLIPPPKNNLERPTNQDKNLNQEIESKLFYPITFPLTTGAVTISVLFTLSAHTADKNTWQCVINSTTILIAVMAMCLIVFIC